MIKFLIQLAILGQKLLLLEILMKLKYNQLDQTLIFNLRHGLLYNFDFLNNFKFIFLIIEVSDIYGKQTFNCKTYPPRNFGK